MINNNELLGISIIVIRDPETQKWLTIKETENRGWWLPGGRVDPPQDFFTAAIREAQEEAGIKVEIQGILRVQNSIMGTLQRMRVIFYAEPATQNEKIKTQADSESEEVRWVTLKELMELSQGSPGWRGPQLYEWGSYIQAGGQIYPVSFLAPFGAQIV